MSKEIDRIDYEFKKRDLSEKYSYAISRLGVCEPHMKEYWRNRLEEVNKSQEQLNKAR